MNFIQWQKTKWGVAQDAENSRIPVKRTLEDAIERAKKFGESVIVYNDNLEYVKQRFSEAFEGSPFESPHHTISELGLFGSKFHSGALERSEGGCLYLDSVQVFRKSFLDELQNRIVKSTNVVIVATAPLDEYGDHLSDKRVAAIQNRMEKYQSMFDNIVIGEGRIPKSSWLLKFNKI